MRKVNQATLDLIKEFEGVRQRAYKDPIGKPTVGVGHLILPGDNIRVGQTITMQRVDELLANDLREACAAVERLAPATLTDNQFGAVVSLVFNIGQGNFAKSQLLQHLKRGQTMAAADSFRNWNKANRQVLPGLTRRRAAERQLFLKP